YEKLKNSTSLNNLAITNRYSPGYCDWKVVDQQKLFSFFPENFCGVSLSETSLMRPIKSVSGIVGIGKNVNYLSYICDKCKNLGCVYRAKKMYVKH
ncbi:MAG: vitamin B12 dependent-methionine synthase activation domain-containing protein, partial [Lutimonas sp.]